MGTTSAAVIRSSPSMKLDEVHEPEPGQQHKAGVRSERNSVNDPQALGRGKDDGRDGRRLQQAAAAVPESNGRHRQGQRLR